MNLFIPSLIQAFCFLRMVLVLEKSKLLLNVMVAVANGSKSIL